MQIDSRSYFKVVKRISFLEIEATYEIWDRSEPRHNFTGDHAVGPPLFYPDDKFSESGKVCDNWYPKQSILEQRSYGAFESRSAVWSGLMQRVHFICFVPKVSFGDQMQYLEASSDRSSYSHHR